MLSRSLTILMTLIFSSTSFAVLKSSDEKDPHFIQVAQVRQNQFAIQICKVEKPGHCQQLGTRTYSAQELSKLKSGLYAKGAWHAFAGAVVVAGAVAVGAIGGQWIALASTTSTSMWSLLNVYFGAILGGATGAAGGVATVSFTMNPMNQFRAARVMSLGTDNKEVKVSARMNYLASLIDARLKEMEQDRQENIELTDIEPSLSLMP